MKKSGIVSIVFLFVILFCSSFKAIYKKQGITITPSELRLFVDQKTDPYTIKIAYTVNVPANYLSSCSCLIFQPYFVAPGQEYQLTPLIISGREYARQEKRGQALNAEKPEYAEAMHVVSTGDGMKIKLSAVVPFQVWMVKAKLRASVTVKRCGRQADLYDLTLADGVIYLPMGPGPVRVKYVKEKAMVRKTFKAMFKYPSGQYLFDREYDGNGPEMQRMMKWMDSLQNNPDMKLTRIVITGSSSPSGASAYNQTIAKKRAEAMKQRFTERKQLNERLIEIRVENENWQQLRLWAEHFPLKNKPELFRIIDGNYTSAQKEEMLRKLPSFPEIEKYAFPELQSVTCEFYYRQPEEVTKIIPL